MPRRTASYRLAELAAFLGAKAAPYYINGPQPGHRLPGWYWRPPGEPGRRYLGFNHIDAEIRLNALAERHLHDQETNG